MRDSDRNEARRSLAASLEAASLSADGVSGLVKIKALSALYLRILPVWFRDDSEDQAKTMAALDRSLRRIDKVMGVCKRFCHRGKTSESSAT